MLINTILDQAASEGKLWGATLFSYPEMTHPECLAWLARGGIRAWITPARVGQSGYFALLVHPEDAESMSSGPILSGGRPSKVKRLENETLRLTPFKREDFQLRAYAMLDNIEQARGMALARKERAELQSLLQAADHLEVNSSPEPVAAANKSLHREVEDEDTSSSGEGRDEAQGGDKAASVSTLGRSSRRAL